MPQAEAKKRASRLSREPVLDKDGDPKRITSGRLTESDRTWLLATAEHLTNPEFLAALTGNKTEPARRRLRLLKRPPNSYIDIWEDQRTHPKSYQNSPQFFVLTENGEDALEEWGFDVPERFPASAPRHRIMADEGMLSFRIGLRRHPEIEFISPYDILKSDNTPERTKRMTTKEKPWYRFPIVLHGERSTVCPDYFPFGFIRPHQPNKPLFLALEFDTGTEPRQKIADKLAAWVYVLEHEIEYTHLGLPNLYITWICGTPRRKEWLKDKVETLVPKRHWRFFLFNTFPLFDSPTKPIADGRLLESDYDRVGREPFNILTSAVD